MPLLVLVRDTLAFGIADCDGSSTLPCTAAENCAYAGKTHRHATTNIAILFVISLILRMGSIA